MFKNVIFDWSGVIKDALECHLWVVNNIFKEFGIKEISEKELQENWEQPHMLFYNKYLPNLTEEEQLPVYKKIILGRDCPKSKSIPGMCELIKRLKGKGYFLGVISTDLSETIFPELKEYGLEDVFDNVVARSLIKGVSLKEMALKLKREVDRALGELDRAQARKLNKFIAKLMMRSEPIPEKLMPIFPSHFLFFKGEKHDNN